MKRITFIILAVFSLLTILQSEVYAHPLRLHVIANSDTALDQTVKLAVRDELLEETQDAFSMLSSVADAKQYVQNHKKTLTEVIDRTLRAYGVPYTSQIEIGRFDFPERDYGNIVYPEGEYEAIRIILGEGSGKNWWCVLFPPLCIVNPANAQPEQDVVYESYLAEIFTRLFA